MTDQELFEKVFGDDWQKFYSDHIYNINLVGRENADRILFFAIWERGIEKDWFDDFLRWYILHYGSFAIPASASLLERQVKFFKTILLGAKGDNKGIIAHFTEALKEFLEEK